MKRLVTIALAAMLTIGTGSAMSGAAAPEKAAETVGAVRACLGNSSIIGRIAEDERTIRFETSGGRVYRNRLSGRCPGLSQAAQGFGALAFELHGDQLCRGDLLRVVDPSRGGALNTAPACPLGPFERVADLPARRQGRH
jgi:hypothetical protein